jgi:hypothetical protein
VCSDGLFRRLPESNLTDLLVKGPDDDARSAALDRQADDNVAAVTVEVLSEA